MRTDGVIGIFRTGVAERCQPSVGSQVLALDVLTSSVCRARSAERRPPSVSRRCTKAESVPRSERRAQPETKRDQLSVGWRFADNARGPWLHGACLRARVWAALRWRVPPRRAAVAVQRQLRSIGSRRLRPYGERAAGEVASSIGAAPAARRAAVEDVQMQWLCAAAAANESSSCTAVAMRVKALAAMHRGGLRGGTEPMRVARRPAAVSPCLCSAYISSFILLSPAAGCLTQPFLCGIDWAYYGTTHCLNLIVFRIYGHL